MRPSLIAATAGLLALLTPAVASADCPKTVSFSGSAKLVDYSGGGALGKRTMTVGEAVDGDKLDVGTVYYVPKGKSAKVKLGRYTSRAGGGSVFIAQCDVFTGKDLYFRLLEGGVKVSGPAIPSGAKGAPSGSYVVTPDATLLPTIGRPSFSAKRTVSSKASTTRTTVQAARGGSSLFVKISSLAARGKQIPCQGGAKVTVFANGKYRNG